MKTHTRIAGIAAALLTLAVAVPAPAGPRTRNETVVLLHGMGRGRLSMWVMSRRLRAAGYDTLSFPYSHLTASLDDTADRLVVWLADKVKTPRYHLVGHSLGNVIIRMGFTRGYPQGLGRIVMLAPPNQPPELAVELSQVPVLSSLLGEAGRSMADPDFYRRLPVPPVPFGVIAGDRSLNPFLDGADDTVVTVEGTRLEGMADWIVLHHTHTFLMNSPDTFEYLARFLETGRFRE